MHPPSPPVQLSQYFWRRVLEESKIKTRTTHTSSDVLENLQCRGSHWRRRIYQCSSKPNATRFDRDLCLDIGLQKDGNTFPPSNLQHVDDGISIWTMTTRSRAARDKVCRTFYPSFLCHAYFPVVLYWKHGTPTARKLVLSNIPCRISCLAYQVAKVAHT